MQRSITTLGLLLVVNGAASAAEQPRPVEFNLLQFFCIHDELKLTRDQRDELTLLYESYQSEIIEATRAVITGERPAPKGGIKAAVELKYVKLAKPPLKKEQMTRLSELTAQRAVENLLAPKIHSAVVESLNLTAEQQDKLMEIIRKRVAEMRTYRNKNNIPIRSRAGAEEMGKVEAQINKKLRPRTLAVLTAEQRALLKKLQGKKPFDFSKTTRELIERIESQ